MTFAVPLSLAERFALVIGGLCQAIGRRGRSGPAGPGLPAPLLVLIWSRLRRMAARFTRLAARGPIPLRSTPPRPAPLRPLPLRPGAEPRLRAPLQPSRAFAALLRLVPETAQYTGQLRYLLDDPEMRALLAAAPGFGRILRPLCRMLGIRPTPALAAKPPLPRNTITATPPLLPSPAPPPPAPLAPPPPAPPLALLPLGFSRTA